MPALKAAEEALNTLDKTSLTYVNIEKKNDLFIK